MSKIKIKEANKGKFTAWAKSHGMTVQEAARHVLANREKYSSTLIKRANFARNAAKWEEGGMFTYPTLPDYKSGGIHINPKNKGKFNATKKRTGKSTEELTHSKNPKTRKRAIFAQNAKKWKHGDGGMIGDGLGGFLENLSPAMSLISGVGGIVGSIIQRNKERKQMMEQREQNAQNFAASSQAAISNNYPAVFKVGGTFKGKKFGGKPNAEVEGGEVIITPDGDTANMYGASHAQGGIDVNLPNNTLILSDKVKIGKGQTAADVARPYTNKINKAKEIMSGNATKLSKRSSELNLNKYYAKVFDAFEKQEKKKFQNGGWKGIPYPIDQSVGNIDPLRRYVWPFDRSGMSGDNNPYGLGQVNISANKPLSVPNMGAPKSGYFSEPDLGGFDPTGFAGAGYDPSDFGDMMGATNPILGSLNNQPSGMSFSNPLDLTDPLASKAETFKNSPFAKNKLSALDVLGGIGELAPTLYNLGQGLFGKREEIDPNKYRNPYESQINSLMANRRYNIDPELIANENAFRTTSANMRNLGGSRGQVMSNVTGAQNVKQFGDMSAYAQKKNMENQYAGEYANMLYGLGRDRSATAMTVDEANAMNRASGRNMVGAGMTGLQQYLLTRRQMKNQASRDKLLGDAIRAYSRYTDKWIPGLKEYNK